MLEAMAEAENRACQNRSKPFRLDVDYFFVEREKTALEYLKSVIAESPYRRLLNDKIHLLQETFLTTTRNIVQFIQNRKGARRTIFLLDQFGYSDVPMDTIAEVLRTLPNAEIILTFAVDSLIDYLSTNERTQKILEQVDLSLPSQMIGEAKEHIDWRRKIQFSLHQEVARKSGARFYTPFFIRSHDAHRDYWLIHLSGHFRARDVMVGLHWKENTSFAHYGRSGLQMLGYDEDLDKMLTSQTVLPGFYFDETALASSQDALIQQLPERINPFADGIAFNDFFAQVTNEAPVTADAMKDVLNLLAREGVVEVRDKAGQKKRSAKITAGSDVLVPSPQKRLFLPGNA